MSTTPESTVGFRILHNYLNDLSVENPIGRLPEASSEELSHHASVSIATTLLAPEAQWQVEVGVQLAANHSGRTIFLLELNYRVVVELQGIPAPVIEHILKVEVPTTVFPIIKEIVERNGGYAGYPTLQLAPFDFRAIHYGA
jgi:protein-export chaperone SecB